MGWKKALFFGGAVLVLAACSDSATAPTALRPADAPSAAWTWPTTTSSTTTSTTPTTSDTTGTVIDPVCTGVVIRTGFDDASTSSTSCASSW
jgi:hypothetical protein